MVGDEEKPFLKTLTPDRPEGDQQEERGHRGLPEGVPQLIPPVWWRDHKTFFLRLWRSGNKLEGFYPSRPFHLIIRSESYT
jgi:hypothetical protein